MGGPIKSAFKKLDVAGRTVAAAIVGGVSAVAGGGKFANGAVSAAFTHLFNAEYDTIAKLFRPAPTDIKDVMKMKAQFELTHSGVSITKENAAYALDIGRAKITYQSDGSASLSVNLVGGKVGYGGVEFGATAGPKIDTNSTIWITSEVSMGVYRGVIEAGANLLNALHNAGEGIRYGFGSYVYGELVNANR